MAFDLETTYGLTEYKPQYDNFNGIGDKYILGSVNDWYYILPNGEHVDATGAPTRIAPAR